MHKLFASEDLFIYRFQSYMISSCWILLHIEIKLSCYLFRYSMQEFQPVAKIIVVLVSTKYYTSDLLKGVGFVYLQTAIDTYSKVAFAKLYVSKNAVVAADLLRDKVVPFFEENGLRVQRILTDRGTELFQSQPNITHQLYQVLI